MSQQRTDIVYKLALCPRFDSWWHHNVKESFFGVTLFCFHFIHYLCNVFSKKSMFCLVFRFAQLYR